jgi:predicted lipoprotein
MTMRLQGLKFRSFESVTAQSAAWRSTAEVPAVAGSLYRLTALVPCAGIATPGSPEQTGSLRSVDFVRNIKHL